MRTFQEFVSLCEEVEDKSKALGFQATIRKARPGGRVGAERKKTAPEMRRTKAVGGGKTAPVGPYKPRKDIGQKKGSQLQQPTQERGSARERQLAAAKEERRKAAQARIAAKKSGGAAPAAAKPKAKEAEKAATKLLSKKKPEAAKPTPAKPRRKWEHPSGGGMTRAERDKARNKEKAEALKKRKAELIKDFTEKHGRAPKGTERTKLLGLAHGTVKAGV